ncbi:MAG: hypothetical protein ACRDQ5_24330 [Sciscionella sp.]
MLIAGSAMLAGTMAPQAAADPNIDPYIDAIAPNTTADVIDPGSALGAPDGRYATVSGRGWVSNRALVLDFGAGEEGVGDIDVYYHGLTLSQHTDIQFLNSNGTTVASTTLTMIGFGDHVVTVDNTSTKSYRYLRIHTTVSEHFGLDAIKTAAVAAQSRSPGGSAPRRP